MTTGRLPVYVEPRAAAHERAWFDAVAVTLGELGHHIEDHPGRAAVSWVWGWDAMIDGQPTVYCELGWLPRWRIQADPRGLNGESSLADPVLPRARKGRRREVREALRALRTTPPPGPSFAYANPLGDPVAHVPDEFILVPLQVEGDRNLRRARVRTMVELVERLTTYDPPLPIVYKQHPALLARDGARGVYDAMRPGDALTPWRDGTVHQYLKHPGCRAVVTLNSNTAHDALLWDVPVVTLEQGVWPCDGPFWQGLPRSWAGFMRYAEGDGMQAARVDYAAWLLDYQYDVADARKPGIVQGLMGAAIDGVER